MKTTHNSIDKLFTLSATNALTATQDGWELSYSQKRTFVSFSQPAFVLASFISKSNINTTMKTLMLTLLFVCSLLSSQAQTTHAKDNFIVLLDLSDRLIEHDQVETDIALINATAQAFVKGAMRKIAFKSEDAFRVVIVPQHGSPLDARKYQSMLHLDLGQTKMALRAKTLKEWESQLQSTLADLYKDAKYSQKHADYQGVDIWQYFNEHLLDDLNTKANNHLLVITDGYFDFEDYSKQQQVVNRYTNTRFLRTLQGQAWQVAAEKGDFGLISSTSLNNYSLRILVGSIRPKKDDLTERAKLEYVWNKWLKEMGVRDYRLINHSYTEKMLGMLNEFHKN